MKKSHLSVALLSVLLYSFPFFIQAQTDTSARNQVPLTTTRANANSLSRQYNGLLERANNYQDYKVVKQAQLDEFYRSAQDSLVQVRKSLQAAQRKITEQKTQLGTLQQTLQGKEKTIQNSQYDEARISVLGMQVLKDRYIITNWLIIATLLILAIVAFVRYRMSNKIAVDARRDYDEVKLELESYRQKLLENKTALGRELQTERNKIEELHQEIAYLQKQLRSNTNSGTSSFRHG